MKAAKEKERIIIQGIEESKAEALREQEKAKKMRKEQKKMEQEQEELFKLMEMVKDRMFKVVEEKKPVIKKLRAKRVVKQINAEYQSQSENEDQDNGNFNLSKDQVFKLLDSNA